MLGNEERLCQNESGPPIVSEKWEEHIVWETMQGGETMQGDGWKTIAKGVFLRNNARGWVENSVEEKIDVPNVFFLNAASLP